MGLGNWITASFGGKGKPEVSSISKREKLATALERCDAVITLLDKRIRSQERKCELLVKDAAAFVNQGKKASALNVMRRRKTMLEAVDGLTKKQMNVQALRAVVEEASINLEIFEAEQEVKKGLTAMTKGMTVESVEAGMEDTREMVQNVKEMSDALAQPMVDDEGALLDDDDDLMADLEQELMMMGLGVSKPSSKKNIPTTSVKHKQQHPADELKALRKELDDEEEEEETMDGGCIPMRA